MNDLPKIDRLVRSKRKTIALIICPDGSLEVRLPLKTPLTALKKLIIEKANWIRKHQQSAKPIIQLTPPQRFQEGALFWYLGDLYPLKVTVGGSSKVEFKETFYLDNRVLSKAETLFTGWYRAQARQVINNRAAYYALHTGLQYQAIRITSARSRWGSCSPSGGLNFSWRLMMAPMDVIDYVIVHELVHTRVRNHSRTFWEQVSVIDPDYRSKRAWLRANGHQFGLLISPVKSPTT